MSTLKKAQDAQAQYDGMDWPQLRRQIMQQTHEVAKDVEQRQEKALEEHLKKIAHLTAQNDFQGTEQTLIQNVNQQKTLLEDAQNSNEQFAAQHADICREKQ